MAEAPERAALAVAEMRAAIDEIGRFVAEPAADRDLVRRAVERAFEILSEASRRLPDEMKATEPEVPWRQIAGIGNVLRHEYDAVDFDLLLASAEVDLPPLAAALERIVGRFGLAI